MKKIHRSILALVLTFTMLLGTCTSAFAATSSSASETVEPGIVTISSGGNVNGDIQASPQIPRASPFIKVSRLHSPR